MMVDKTEHVWIVGEVIDGTEDWWIKGIYDSDDEAAKMCKNYDTFFILGIPVNEQLDEDCKFPGYRSKVTH